MVLKIGLIAAGQYLRKFLGILREFGSRSKFSRKHFANCFETFFNLLTQFSFSTIEMEPDYFAEQRKTWELRKKQNFRKVSKLCAEIVAILFSKNKNFSINLKN